ncbi:GFA family protein [Sneathiella sp.]|uniref:GFA family protein n=1 Tax=Sneathiella sp. TaxID=1964365 RepID=UPI003562876B
MNQENHDNGRWLHRELKDKILTVHRRTTANKKETTMKLTGHCYCGELKYEAEGEVLAKGNCHCRECQYMTGGHPLAFLVMPEAGFKYVEGAPAIFRRSDLENPRTREFCANCGTHILSKSRPGAVVLKVGTLDDPSVFDKPDMSIFLIDKQPFHHIDETAPTYERMKT